MYCTVPCLGGKGGVPEVLDEKDKVKRGMMSSTRKVDK